MPTMIAELRRDESVRLTVYDDATGHPIVAGSHVIGNPTIGTGRNLVGRGITDDENNYLCQNDIADVCEELDEHFAWWEFLDPVRQRVMVNMCFNMGVAKLQGFPHFLAAAQSGNWQVAHDEMLNSAWANEVGDRAKRLASMMLTGVA